MKSQSLFRRSWSPIKQGLFSARTPDLFGAAPALSFTGSDIGVGRGIQNIVAARSAFGCEWEKSELFFAYSAGALESGFLVLEAPALEPCGQSPSKRLHPVDYGPSV